MKKSLLSLLIMVMYLPLFAQRNPTNEILVYFNQGVSWEASLNNGITTRIVKVKKQSLKEALKKLDIQETDLEVAAPDFNRNDTIHTLPDGKALRRLDMSKSFVLTVKQVQSKEEIITKLNALPEVLFAQSNRVSTFPDAEPNDVFFKNSPNPSSLPNQKPIFDKAGITAAWDTYTGNVNNIIGLIDYGMDETHPDLDSKIVSSDAPGIGNNDHATPLAGILAAETNATTSQGIAGTDWKAKILPKNIDGLTTSQAISNVIIATANGSHVLNNSWHLNSDNEEIRAAFAYAYKANRVTVAAMGTSLSAGEIAYPAAFNNVLAIGATNLSDQVETSSGRGNHIDVVAPTNITTTAYANGNATNNYKLMGGTSAATAVVSGIASLLKGYKPSLYNDDIEHLIRLGADDISPAGFDNNSGYGRVNAARSINFLKAPYSLNSYTTTGGTAGTPSASYSMKFVSAGSLANGTYTVVRRSVTKAVTFPTSYCQIIGVWGVGYTSSGWSSPPTNSGPASTNFGVGFTEIVPGTLTNNGATLRTYIYDVYSSTNQFLGTYPTTAANVQFGYSVLGLSIPAITPDSYSDYGSGTSYQPLYSYNTVSPPTYISALFNLAGTTSSSAQVIYSSHYSSWNYSSGPTNGYLSFNLDYPNQSISFRITASNGTCQSFYDVTFNTTDGMGLYVYSPNPANDDLTVEYKYKADVSTEKKIKKDFEVKLIDNKGTVVRSGRNSSEANKILLDTRTLPNDTYFLHIIEGKIENKSQIIIKH